MQNIKPGDVIDIRPEVPYDVFPQYSGYREGPLSDDDTEIAGKFGMPEVAARLIDFFFTGEDKEFIRSYQGVPVPVKGAVVFRTSDQKSAAKKAEISRGIELSYASDAFSRGVLARVRRQDTPEGDAAKAEDFDYMPGGFYGFLDVFVVSQTKKYHTLPAEIRAALDKWYFDEYEKSLDPDKTHRPTSDRIISLDEMLDFIDAEERPLYLARCDCKCLGGKCGNPTNTCINFVHGDNSLVTRKIATPITKEQAKQVIRDADKAGLVHTISDHGICNCDEDCCYLFRVQKDRGSTGFWPQAPHIIAWYPERCIGCGKCLKRCRFGVFRMSGRGKGAALALTLSKCNGCGICASTCPGKALSLTDRKPVA